MTEQDFTKQVDELKEAAARSISPCLTAKYIALADSRVRELFLKKVEEKNVFRGIDCLNRISIPENRLVYFEFECPADRVCLIKPAFAVIVNIVTGSVVTVIDPYLAEADTSRVSSTVATSASPLSGSTALQVIGTGEFERSGGTLPLAGDGTLPLAGDGTLPLGGGSLPLRVLGYVLVPAGWRFGNG